MKFDGIQNGKKRKTMESETPSILFLHRFMVESLGGWMYDRDQVKRWSENCNL